MAATMNDWRSSYTDAEWDAAVKGFKTTGAWEPRRYGPRPMHDGCRVPKSILGANGYAIVVNGRDLHLVLPKTAANNADGFTLRWHGEPAFDYPQFPVFKWP